MSGKVHLLFSYLQSIKNAEKPRLTYKNGRSLTDQMHSLVSQMNLSVERK